MTGFRAKWAGGFRGKADWYSFNLEFGFSVHSISEATATLDILWAYKVRWQVGRGSSWSGSGRRPRRNICFGSETW